MIRATIMRAGSVARATIEIPEVGAVTRVDLYNLCVHLAEMLTATEGSQLKTIGGGIVGKDLKIGVVDDPKAV